MIDFQDIPDPIAEAISAIMATTEAVKKSQFNKHGSYKYASTDDIYAALTKKMGEVGLVIIGLEDDCEIVRMEAKDATGAPKTVQWARLVFSFVLAAGGATWTHKRLRRTLYIQITGPQTFQSAQSYAEKAFLRSTFKLPTGDMDLDSMPQGESEEEQVSASAPAAKRKSSYAAKKDGASPQIFNEIGRHIEGCGDRDSLQYIKQTYKNEWAQLPAQWSGLLDEQYEVKFEQFERENTLA